MIVVGCMNAVTSKSLYTKLQRFITGKNVTHSFVILDQYYDDFQLLDAKMSVTLCPFSFINHPGNEVWLYKINIDEKKSYDLRKLLYQTYIGENYGFSQLIWFVWRRINEILFKRNMRNKKNWFSNGILCSEIVWNTLYNCSINDENLKKIDEFLFQYNVNSFHSGDCKELLDLLVSNKIIEKLEVEKYVTKQ